MIELYTDGSFYDLLDGKYDNIAGIGFVIRLIDDCYKDEYLIEEFYAYRYTKKDLEKILNTNKCFEDISSMFIEALSLAEAFSIVKSEYMDKYPNEELVIYTDCYNNIELCETYYDHIKNGTIISFENYSGGFLCMLSSLFGDNINLINRVSIKHIKGHNNNDYNCIADLLAKYKYSPKNRVLHMMKFDTYKEYCDYTRDYMCKLQLEKKNGKKI